MIVSAVFLGAFAVASAYPVPAPPAKGKDVAPLEKKLLGKWKGEGRCDGLFVFQADGTYTREKFGPLAANSAGTWEVRWDALPPTLVLTCKTSSIPEFVVGKTREVKIIEPDDSTFTIKYPDVQPEIGRFARVKE